MVSKETLQKWYIDDQLTGKEIAQLVGVKSASTIYNWLIKYEIPRRNRYDAQRPFEISKENLNDLYSLQKLSMDAIAHKFNSSKTRISKLLCQYGIPKRKKWYKIAGWNKGITLSPERCHQLSEMAKRRTGCLHPRFGVTHLQETKDKISNSLKGRYRGPDNPNWKGGYTSERRMWMGCHEYMEWRSIVFKRDNYTCQMCNTPSKGDIEAHHIYPWEQFPLQRFNTDNGITLCIKCHRSIKNRELEYIDFFLNILKG